MDHLDPWAILHTQEEWALHIPQPISTNLSLPVTTTTTCDADKRVTVGFQPQPPVPQPSPSSPCPSRCRLNLCVATGHLEMANRGLGHPKTR